MMKQTVRAAQVVRGIQIKDADLINLLFKEMKIKLQTIQEIRR